MHAALLGEIAAAAQAREAGGDVSGALTEWRRAADLLPADTAQAAQVRERIAALSRQVDAPPPATGRGGLAAAAAIGLAALGKAKFLLAGLAKLPTLLTMLLSMGVYASLWGWKFAVGFVASIYVHEIGHVVALARYGIPATAPMFVPGFGALVRLKGYPTNPREDATVGLAGPIWGLGAAAVCAAVWVGSGSELFGALARVGAYINLFNLVPIGQLDGGRGWRALDRTQRWLAVAALVAGWALCEDPLVMLLALAGVARAAVEAPPREGHLPSLATYAALVGALCGLLAWLAWEGVAPRVAPTAGAPGSTTGRRSSRATARAEASAWPRAARGQAPPLLVDLRPQLGRVGDPAQRLHQVEVDADQRGVRPELVGHEEVHVVLTAESLAEVATQGR